MPSFSHSGCLRGSGWCGKATIRSGGFAHLRSGREACGEQDKGYAILWERSPPKAGMAELADAADSKSADRKVVGVRPPLPAPTKRATCFTPPRLSRLLLPALRNSISNPLINFGLNPAQCERRERPAREILHVQSKRKSKNVRFHLALSLLRV